MGQRGFVNEVVLDGSLVNGAVSDGRLVNGASEG